MKNGDFEEHIYHKLKSNEDYYKLFLQQEKFHSILRKINKYQNVKRLSIDSKIFYLDIKHFQEEITLSQQNNANFIQYLDLNDIISESYQNKSQQQYENEESDTFCIDQESQNLIEQKFKNYNDPSSQNQVKYYAIINLNSTPLWDQVYESVYQGFWQDETEIWENYYAPQFQFPDIVKDLKKYSGIVVTGGHFSCLQSHEWIQKLFQFYKDLHEQIPKQNPQIKIVTICLGHQSFSKAMGGKVENLKGGGLMECDKLVFADSEQSALKKNFVKGCEDFINKITQQGFLRVSKTQSDHVVQLPPKADFLFKCVKTNYHEVYTLGENFLSLQFHPEFNWTLVNYMINSLGEWHRDQIYQKAAKSFSEGVDQKETLGLVYNFLKG